MVLKNAVKADLKMKFKIVQTEVIKDLNLNYSIIKIRYELSLQLSSALGLEKRLDRFPSIKFLG